ncbi:MAG: polysaccharide biosynthesis protein [Eubacterium sp.]|nr:polysaccharide biosynthesis protein [Candidatus Colimonas fimequi]
MSESTKKSLVSGAAVLAVAGLFVKFLGAFFRIPLGNLIGTVGMANYTPAYSLYNFLLVFSVTGLPVAVSKMVSERRAVGQYVEAERVFKLSRSLMLIMGIVGCVFVFCFADAIAQLVHVPGSALSMKATAPALVLVPLMASYRGYFQGMQEMSPTAVSQVVEQIFRVGVGLSLAIFLMNSGLFTEFTPQERGAAGGCFGASAGAVGGLIAVLVVYLLKRNKVKREIRNDKEAVCESSGALIKKILYIAIPITIGTAIMPIVNLVDAGVVSTRLAASGWDQLAAQDLYGQLTGFASPLVGFPQILTQAIVLSLVPMVSAAFRKNDTAELHDNLSLGFRMSMIIGIPCATGLFVLAKPILMLLYPTQRESAISATPCLQILAIGFVFLAIVLTITGGLQGITKQMVPVVNLFVGVVLKFVVTWVLVAIPAINVLGAAVGTVTAYAFAATMDTVMLIKFTKVKFPWKLIFLKPLISAVIMGVVTIIVYKVIFMAIGSNLVATAVAIMVAVPLYGILIIKTKAIGRDEMMGIGIGRKIARICDKLRLW